MKVSGGLVGITLNESAPYCARNARLPQEAKCMAGLSRETPGQHHCLSAAIEAREEEGVHQLTTTIDNFTNHFLVSNDSAPNTHLYNLVTKVVMSKKTNNDWCQQSEIGRKLFHTFVDDRVLPYVYMSKGESTSDAISDADTSDAEVKVVVAGGMAEVQSLDKPDWMKNSLQLAEHFNDRLFFPGGNQEIRLVFDRYNIPSSLKTST